MVPHSRRRSPACEETHLQLTRGHPLPTSLCSRPLHLGPGQTLLFRKTSPPTLGTTSYTSRMPLLRQTGARTQAKPNLLVNLSTRAPLLGAIALSRSQNPLRHIQGLVLYITVGIPFYKDRTLLSKTRSTSLTNISRWGGAELHPEERTLGNSLTPAELFITKRPRRLTQVLTPLTLVTPRITGAATSPS